MLKAAARLFLLRILPRRIVPILTIVEALLLLRSVRRRSRGRVTARVDGHAGEPVAAPTAADPT